MSLVVVTGPTRSGKSAFAEKLAAESKLPVMYVATARSSPDDPEWQARIDRHRNTRPETWQTLEEPLDLATLFDGAESDRCYLVDSLGTWVANWIEAEEAEWESRAKPFVESLSQTAATVIVVSEEVGWGVVPAFPMGRMFRDRLGLLVQDVAAMADCVYLVVAGYAIDVKQLGQKV